MIAIANHTMSDGTVPPPLCPQHHYQPGCRVSQGDDVLVHQFRKRGLHPSLLVMPNPGPNPNPSQRILILIGGAIILGSTVMTEFGVTPLGWSAHFQGPRNAHHPGHYPGGSSSGSAVAVACGLVPVAIGFDGGG